jgi:branched-subunit amino acid aminotransferase/4-amino-4-deoxychorismate lyase
MHYYLADLAARKIDPQARAVLLDADGTIVETATANILLFDPQIGLIAPPRAAALPGISLATVEELAREAGMALVERRVTPGDAMSAAEMLLCSTPYCLLPVVRFDGQPIGAGRPGPVFEQLISLWSRRVGIDIRGQAARFFARGQGRDAS